MWSFTRWLGGRLFSRAREQWAPTLRLHDPINPLPLEGSTPEGTLVNKVLGNATLTASGTVHPAGPVVATLGAATSSGLGYALPPSILTVGATVFNADADRLIITSGAVPVSNTGYAFTFWFRPQAFTNDPSFLCESDAAGSTLELAINAGVLSLQESFTQKGTIGSTLSTNVWKFAALRVTSSTTAVISIGDQTTACIHSSPITISAQGATFHWIFPGTGNWASNFAVADFCLGRMWDSATVSDADIEAERTSATPVRSANLVSSWPVSSAANKLLDVFGSNPLTAAGAGPWSDTTGPSFTGPTVGALQRNLGDATLAASGSGGSVNVDGTVAKTLGDATLVASGVSLVSGTTAKTLGDATAVGTGQVYQTALDWHVLMPHINPGKPTYGSGTASTAMNDGAYGYTTDGAWAMANGDWAAINLGADPVRTHILVAFSNDNATGGGYLSNSFADYRVQASNNSTNGSDGTWTTLLTITGNPYMNREHKLAFAGYSWVKLIIDSAAQGQLDEFDVWDATNGTPDTFALLGDSITDGMARRFQWSGGGYVPSFQTDVKNNQPGHYPLQCNLGKYAEGAAYWATNIGTVLADFPDLKYWLVTIGMNDGSTMPSQISTYLANMYTVIDAILAAGRVPVLARTTYTGSASYGGGDPVTCGLRYLNDNGVDVVIANRPSVRVGPDLYAYFVANDVAFGVTTDPHPNVTGYLALMQVWADSLGVNTTNSVYGNENALLGDASLAASGTASAASVTGTLARTLGDATLAAAGGVGASGSVAKTLADAGLAASGVAQVTGSLAKTLVDASLSATGSHAIGGAVAKTLADATLAAAGGVGASGSLAKTLADATLAAVGQFGAGISGTVAKTLGDATLVAPGWFLVSGSTSSALANATSTVSGGVGASGSTSSTLANATLAASGSSVTGTTVKTLNDFTLVASGNFVNGVNGSVAQTLASVSPSASGGVGASGSTSSTLANATLSASGGVIAPISGTLARQMGDATLVASGTVRAQGALSATLADVQSAATGARGATGSTTLTLANASLAASGSFLGNIDGSLAKTLGDFALASVGVLASLHAVEINNRQLTRGSSTGITEGSSQVILQSTPSTKVTIQ